MKKLYILLVFSFLMTSTAFAAENGILYDYDVDWLDHSIVNLTYGDGSIVKQPKNLKFLMINGTLINDNRTDTVITKNSYSLVPVRIITEKIGTSIDWDDKARKVTLTSKDLKIEMTIDKKDVLVNGKSQTMQIAPEIINNYTYLPLRFISEQLACTVNYYDENIYRDKWANEGIVFAFPNSLISIESKKDQDYISSDEALLYLNKTLNDELTKLQTTKDFKDLDVNLQKSVLQFSKSSLLKTKLIDELGRYYCYLNDNLYLVDKYSKDIYVLNWKYEMDDYKARKIEKFSSSNSFVYLILKYLGD